MIKDQMTLPLDIDTANLKSTTAVLTTAPDSDILPYTIGYLPWELMEQSSTYRKVLIGDAVASPGQFLQYNPEEVFSETTKGVPFIYTIKKGLNGRLTNLQYDGQSYVHLPVGNNENNIEILAAYNTQYYVNNSTTDNIQIDGIQLTFYSFEVATQQEGWQGQNGVNMPRYFTITATISGATGVGSTVAQSLRFTYSLASEFGTYTYNLDETVLLNMWDNGVIEIDGGTYETGGQSYSRKLYLILTCCNFYAPGSAVDGPGFGAVIEPDIRRSQFDYPTSPSTILSVPYLTTVSDASIFTNEDILVDEEFPSQYGCFYSTSQTGVCIFRSARIDWVNYIVSGGMTLADINLAICCALPLYYIQDENENWGYYVAEFNDDYQITGRLIPFSEAREWQKNINGDTNEFDPADIPEPEPEPETYNDEGDIDFNTNIPSGTSGFITQYILTSGQIGQIGNALWAAVVDSTQLMRNNFFLIEDPSQTGYELSMANILDYFISLKYFPFDLTNVIRHHNSTVNGILVGAGTEAIPLAAPPPIADQQVVILDGGQVKVDGKFESFLGHEPNTTASIYVPYCGSIEVPASMIMGYTLRLKYAVDLITGGVKAILIKTGDGATFPIATLNGTMGFEILMTGNNASTVIANANSAFVNRGVNAMTSLISAGLSGNPATGGAALGTQLGGLAQWNANLPQLLGTSPMTSGSTASLAGLISPQTAYVHLRYHVPVGGDTDWSVVGGLVDKVMSIGSTNGMGYVQIVNPKLNGVPCTREEKEEIKSLLAHGIFT